MIMKKSMLENRKGKSIIKTIKKVYYDEKENYAVYEENEK